MPLVKRIKSRRGVNMVVVAEAELLFAPNGDISRWNNALSQKVRRTAANAAPVNKRPRWGHYGKPLKKTFRAASDIQVRNGGGVAYSAVGSTAPYAAYVDQGTNSFNAKILPPWHRFSPSLYEHTWKVPGSASMNDDGTTNVRWGEIGTVRVSGQSAQLFFAAGLRYGMGGLTLSSQIGSRGITGVIQKPVPQRLVDQVTTDYNAGNAAFMASLTEWRSWRDSAWANDRYLGQGMVRYSEVIRRNKRALIKERSAEARRVDRKERRKVNRRSAQERYRRKQGARPRADYERDRRTGVQNKQARTRDRARARAMAAKKFGESNIVQMYFSGGRWRFVIKGPGRSERIVSLSAQFPGAAGTPDDDF